MNDQTKAPTQPKKVHPKNKLRTKIATLFLRLLEKAINVGKKYSNTKIPSIKNIIIEVESTSSPYYRCKVILGICYFTF